jgi:DNA polymerase
LIRAALFVSITDMTAETKHVLARFLDTAAVSLRGGRRVDGEPYEFSDDPPGYPEAAPAQNAQSAKAAQSAETAQDAEAALLALNGAVRACRACGLSATRTGAVPGEGAARPLLLVVGEGPGADEDATGRPFVGRAGQLLDKMLASIGLSRETNCFIANVVKCRPPHNRDPDPAEIAACRPFLNRQIELLRPKAILCAGRFAAQTLLATTEGIGKLRGRFFGSGTGDGAEIPLLPTYHPSALLRDESLKRPAWEDLKLLRGHLAALDDDYAHRTEKNA